MRVNRRWIALVISAGLLVVLGAQPKDGEVEPKTPPASLHDSFETAQVAWEREHTDTTINLIAQDRSVRAAHDGNLSEHFQFDADTGSQFFVSYALPKVPVTDKLQAVLHVRANRVGVQLYGRVVLPADIDSETRAPSFVLIQGTIYDRVDRWQRLELTDMLPSIERQARVLRASSRRPVSLKGAYLERLVVNLMGGPGASEVFLDDLSVSPVPGELLTSWTTPEARKSLPGKPAGGSRPSAGRTVIDPIVRLDRNRLRRQGEDRKYHDWLPTAIDAPGADVTELRRYGFDVLVDDRKSDPERIKTAIDKGFLLMPRLSAISSKTDPHELLEEVGAYPHKDVVAFWQIGESLGRKREMKSRDEELSRARKVVTAMRQLPAEFSRITTGLVDGDLPLFSRAPGNLDTIGIQPQLWASSQEFLESLEFLKQRRQLTSRSNLGGLFWAWIPTTASAVVRANIWGDDVPPSWGVPQVGPEQLRLMTYMALSAGYRGLGFLGDADLTRPAGRALLIELAFLNEEIDLCESILARSADPIPVYHVFDPDPPDLPPPGTPPGTRVKPQKEFAPKPGLLASAIAAERKGALLLLADYAGNAQFQPPQMAARNLVIRANMPESAQAFEISPGEVKLLPRERAPGGTQIILDEFCTTAMILCTTDLGLKERVEAAIARVRPLAVQLAIEQAELMLQAVAEINGRLNADGQHLITADELKRRADAGIVAKPTDERDLLAKAEASIKSAREAQEREDFALAWAEARRAGRPLRTLMFGHWVKANGTLAGAAGGSFSKPADRSPRPIPVLIKPVCCAPCVAFNTLPELYFWVDWIKGKPGYKFGANRIPSGSFDDPKAMTEAGWVNVDHELDGITAKMSTVPREGKPGDRMIRMSVEPKNKEELDNNLPFFDFPVAAIRTPAIKADAKNLIRISVQVKRSIASAPGMGGIIVRDSLGGEQLQYRTSDPIPSFSRVVIYRKAPTDCSFTVTFGLAGYGEVFFDDFRVELVEADEPSGGSDIAQAPANRSARQPPSPDPSLPPTATSPSGSRTRRQ
ncbi:MAG: hypothetical protein ACLQU5_35275 [Isosphaeraceae bacterium]